MFQIAICDDEPVFLRHAAATVSDIMGSHGFACNVLTFSNPETLLESLKHNIPDVLLLDILFEKENGIQTARIIRARGLELPIIFITSSMDYVLDGYTVESVGYLIKPLDYKKMEEALLRVYMKLDKKTLLLQTGSNVVRFYPNDLLYAEVFDKTITLHMMDGHTMQATIPLSVLMDRLPSKQFIQCHRSYIASLKEISSIWRYGIELSSHQNIPVSKTFYKDVQQALLLRELDAPIV
ncbi:MAG: response regulator transcription factor [Clostridia bacterium]|nr:response regulator transcription factor [Clostridia bacterium]